MDHMTSQNLQNIKTIFQEQTSVALVRPRRRRVKLAALLAAAMVCLLAVTGFALVEFSSLAGDDLGFSSEYLGQGLVAIRVENRSDKVLRFQQQLKLMRWSAGEVPLSGPVLFENTEFAPHSQGTMTVDLSGACDVAELEKPLTDDHYYLVLTNNNFLFGQDWMCSVRFGEVHSSAPVVVAPPAAHEALTAAVEEALRPYFATITFDPAQRRAMQAEYAAAYEALFAEFSGTIVPSVSPMELTLDADLPQGVLEGSFTEEQLRELVGLHRRSVDHNFKLLASEGETALTISTVLPQANCDALPLLYVLIYEKEAVRPDACAFIRGRLLTFEELEEQKVFEDQRYVCYEVSSLVWSDVDHLLEDFAAQYPGLMEDQGARQQVEAVLGYYREHLSQLFYYR